MTHRFLQTEHEQYTVAPSSALRVCFSSQVTSSFPHRRQRTIASNFLSLRASYFSCSICEKRVCRTTASSRTRPTMVPLVRISSDAKSTFSPNAGLARRLKAACRTRSKYSVAVRAFAWHDASMLRHSDTSSPRTEARRRRDRTRWVGSIPRMG